MIHAVVVNTRLYRGRHYLHNAVAEEVAVPVGDYQRLLVGRDDRSLRYIRLYALVVVIDRKVGYLLVTRVGRVADRCGVLVFAEKRGEHR